MFQEKFQLSFLTARFGYKPPVFGIVSLVGMSFEDFKKRKRKVVKVIKEKKSIARICLQTAFRSTLITDGKGLVLNTGV